MNKIVIYNREAKALEEQLNAIIKGEEVDKVQLKEQAHELLERIKKAQDQEEYIDLNDDLEDIIYRIIEIIGQI